MKAIPETVVVDDHEWQVSRVWPREKVGFPTELRHNGQIRGAFWDGQAFDVCEEYVDPRLPCLGDVVQRTDGVLVSHRPGKRAVVRARQGSFVKVVRPGRSSAVLLGVARSEPFAATFRTPAVLDHDSSTVTFSPVAGRSLHTGGSWSFDEWSLAWEDILQAWEDAIFADPGDAPRHDAMREAVILSSWASKVVMLDDHEMPWMRNGINEVISELATLPEPTQVTIIHRDLHDKQLLWDSAEGPGLIDLDTVSSGDPSSDLGNLWAHAILRELQGLWDARQAAAVRELIGQVSERTHAINSVAYARATLVRLACIYSFRPAWRQLAPHLVQEAQRL